MCLLEKDHLGAVLGRGQRRHGSGRSTADDQDVTVQPDGTVKFRDLHQATISVWFSAARISARSALRSLSASRGSGTSSSARSG
ncbi:Uncharacterised protein [Mycobacteroides abscessus subsp. massiliense]|nr:Uncharacterised protein [Mycobacteroides abscessus subsp. massiliense]